jgi:hypothetical protein
VPGADHCAEVHRIIYDELCLGIIRESSRVTYRATINRLVEAGAEGVILGCTEIELLIGSSDSPVPVFPTTRLHVEAAVAAALLTESSFHPQEPATATAHLRWPDEGASSFGCPRCCNARRLPGIG